MIIILAKLIWVGLILWSLHSIRECFRTHEVLPAPFLFPFLVVLHLLCINWWAYSLLCR